MRSKKGLVRSLIEQALACANSGNQTIALSLLHEAKELADEINDPEILGLCLLNQAAVLDKNQSSRDQAKQLVERAALLAQQYGLESLAKKVEIIDRMLSANVDGFLYEMETLMGQRKDDSGSLPPFADLLKRATMPCPWCGEVGHLHCFTDYVMAIKPKSYDLVFEATCTQCMWNVLVCVRNKKVVHLEALEDSSKLPEALKRSENIGLQR